MRASMIFDFLRFFAGSLVQFFKAFSFLLRALSDLEVIFLDLTFFLFWQAQQSWKNTEDFLAPQGQLGPWDFLEYPWYVMNLQTRTEATTDPRSGKQSRRVSAIANRFVEYAFPDVAPSSLLQPCWIPGGLNYPRHHSTIATLPKGQFRFRAAFDFFWDLC